MEKIRRIAESEKELITVLGKMPKTSPKELFNYTKYKWMSTIVRKIDKLKEKDIIWGPYYDIDYGKLCRNSLHVLVCILEFDQSYEIVISCLDIIGPKWIYPVLSSNRKLLHVGFISSNDKELLHVLNILKMNDVITDYTVRTCTCKWITVNPNFFGDSNPSLDNLLSSCDTPNMAYGQHTTDWTECDISVLPYLQVGYKGTKLIEILKAEKKIYSREWKYHQIKYSRKKMIRKKLIEKKYSISPFPRDKCAHFILFLKTESIEMTRRILHNFAFQERVFKEYTMCKDWGMLSCQSNPLFLTNLMEKLDQIKEIKNKELYQLRSYPGKYFFKQSFENKFFNFEEQTLEYPYNIYKEKIKEKIANSQ